MRITDDRYAGERARFDLVLRLIGHQARTHIISWCTGFSQDRIRKVYATYFSNGSAKAVKRRRGKSPSSVDFFMRNPWVQAEATLLVHLFAAWELLSITPDLRVTAGTSLTPLTHGQRLCDAFDEFCATQGRPRITFDHAWGLHAMLVEGRDLRLLDCSLCAAIFVQDALAVAVRRCPACRVSRRHGPPPPESQLRLPIA
jgi:hypothetical protein